MRKCRSNWSGRTGAGAAAMDTLITAFCTLPDMIDAAELVLNAAQT